MATTIAVVPDCDKKGYFKVLVNYVQRGITYSQMELANQEATKLSETMHTDHLILCKGEIA